MMPAKLLPLILGASVVSAHMRLKFPPARNDDTGLKSYPCGGTRAGSGAITTLQPGPVTVIVEETVSHKGAPMRYSPPPLCPPTL